jgi:Uncharacterized conserved protein (DUF2183)
MRRGTPCGVADCRRMRADTQRTDSSAGSAESRARVGRGLLGAVLVWLALALAGCAGGPRPDRPSTPPTASGPVHDNRRSVTVVPTWAAVDGTGNWQFTLRIWASKARTVEMPEWVVRELTDDLDGLDPAEKELLAKRAADFFADDDSFEEVTFRFVADPAHELFRFEDRTDFNGIVQQSFSLPIARAQEIARVQGAGDGWLTIEAGYRDVKGQGRIKLLAPSGRSVVTDIDDTIKVTEILKGRAAVLRNTFLKAFEAVPGMRDRYAAYGDGVVFHYVSGAPWQLYRALDQFLIEESGFPEGTFHMKYVPKNMAEPATWRAWRNLIAGEYTVEQKKAEIAALIKACPERRFILIGDSGERDPEIFAAIRDEFPDRVEEILIRDVRGDALEPGSSRLHDMTVIPP